MKKFILSVLSLALPIMAQAQNVVYQQDFQSAGGSAGTTGGSWQWQPSDETPPVNGGVSPNPGNLQYQPLLPTNTPGASYVITSPGPAGSVTSTGWTPSVSSSPPVTNGQNYYPVLSTQPLPNSRLLLGCRPIIVAGGAIDWASWDDPYCDLGSPCNSDKTLPLNQLVWQTKMAFSSGQSYRFSFAYRDLFPNGDPNLGGHPSSVENGAPCNFQVYLFGDPAAGAPGLGTTPRLLQQDANTNSNIFQSSCFTVPTGTWRIGIEVIGADPGKMAYFALDDLTIRAYPTIPDPVVNSINSCGPITNGVSLSVIQPVTGATYTWYTSSSPGQYQQVYTGTTYTVSGTIASTRTYYVSASGGCEPTRKVPVSININSRLFVQEYRQDFQSAGSSTGTTAGSWQPSDETPPVNGGVSPNPGGLQYQPLLPTNTPGASYVITSPGPAGSVTSTGWTPSVSSSPPVTNGQNYYPVLSTQPLPNSRLLLGCRPIIVAGGAIDWASWEEPDPYCMDGSFPCNLTRTLPLNQLVWQTKMAFSSGQSYRFSFAYRDLFPNGDPNLGGHPSSVENGAPCNFQVYLFGDPTAAAPGLGTTPRLLGDFSGTTNIFQSQEFQVPTGTWRIGIEVIGADPGKMAYFALDDLTIEKVICGIAPTVANTNLSRCGPGDLTFTATSPAPLPAALKYQWFTRDTQGQIQLLTPSPISNPVYTIPMPTGALDGIARKFYIRLVKTVGSSTEYWPETEVRGTWYREVPAPTFQPAYPISLVGHANQISIANYASAPYPTTYAWTGAALITQSQQSAIITPDGTGISPATSTLTYTVTGTGPGACSATSSFSTEAFRLNVSNQTRCDLQGPILLEVPVPDRITRTDYEYRWYDNGQLTVGPTYLASIGTGSRTLMVCVGKSGGGPVVESEHLSVTVTWYQRPPDPAVLSQTTPPFDPSPTAKGIPVTRRFSPYGGMNYTWDWGDGSATKNVPNTHTYSSPGHYNVTLTIRPNNTTGTYSPDCPATYVYPIDVQDVLCEVYIPVRPGSPATRSVPRVGLKQNARDGSFAFTPVSGGGACPETEIVWDCLSSEIVQPDSRVIVAASAQSLQPARVQPSVKDNGVQTHADALVINPITAGAGYLRAESGYAYSTSLLTGGKPGRQGGRFTLRPFSWNLSSRTRPRAWIAAGVATRHNPNGEAVEEQDVLGVPSAVRFGYAGQALPYITAKNADYDALLFESFESAGLVKAGGGSVPTLLNFDADGTFLQFRLSNACAHAGQWSIALSPNSSFDLPVPAKMPSAWLSNGIRVQVWIRVESNAGTSLKKVLKKEDWLTTAPVSVVYTAPIATTLPLTAIAQVGEWTLCQGIIPAAQMGLNNISFQVSGAGTALNYSYWLDDMRLQPVTAQATAYVYDPVTLKLTASFDDQHFGLFYKYDAEGRLTHKQVETIRGRQTVQETQYNTPKGVKLTN
jgi:hypothetical protein